MSEKAICDVLHAVQVALKVPKDEWNDFGKYRYRNAESILQSVKPLLPDGCFVVVNVTPEVVGGRLVCMATATIEAEGNAVTATAYAVEPDSKKGMDSAQVSGATISYAKKYALANLFAIDGTKDSDAEEATKSPQKADVGKGASEVQRAAMRAAQAASEALEREQENLRETFKRYRLALAGRGAEVTFEQIRDECVAHAGKPMGDWCAADYADARVYLETQIGGE